LKTTARGYSFFAANSTCSPRLIPQLPTRFR